MSARPIYSEECPADPWEVRFRVIGAEPSPSPQGCRDYAAMQSEHKALIDIAERTRRIAAGIEATRQKLEGLLFRATVGRGLTEQMGGELLQLRVEAESCARALESEVEGAAQLREAGSSTGSAAANGDAVGALERAALRTD